MTTVGYGDIYPKSDFGRAVALLACFVGTLFISVLVTVMTLHCNVAVPEENVLRLVKKDDAYICLQNMAAKRLQHAWLGHKLSRTKVGSLDVCSKTKTMKAYSRLAHTIVNWRIFFLEYK